MGLAKFEMLTFEPFTTTEKLITDEDMVVLPWSWYGLDVHFVKLTAGDVWFLMTFKKLSLNTIFPEKVVVTVCPATKFELFVEFKESMSWSENMLESSTCNSELFFEESNLFILTWRFVVLIIKGTPEVRVLICDAIRFSTVFFAFFMKAFAPLLELLEFDEMMPMTLLMAFTIILETSELSPFEFLASEFNSERLWFTVWSSLISLTDVMSTRAAQIDFDWLSSDEFRSWLNFVKIWIFLDEAFWASALVKLQFDPQYPDKHLHTNVKEHVPLFRQSGSALQACVAFLLKSEDRAEPMLERSEMLMLLLFSMPNVFCTSSLLWQPPLTRIWSPGQSKQFCAVGP